MLPVLDKRLSEIAKVVKGGRVTCDVGTDHGYLIAYLAASGHIPKGYACDINTKPLDAAKATVQKYGVETTVNCILTDGLYGMDNKNIEEIIIAGMGGDLIWDILAAAQWTRSPKLHFVLQPMTKVDQLRRTLYANGFEIAYENAVVSGRFVYTVMSVHFTGKTQELSLLESFIGKVQEGGSPDTAAYLKRVAHTLKERADGMAKSDTNSNNSTVYYEVYDEIGRILEQYL